MTVIFGKVYVQYNDTMYYVTRIIKESLEPNVDAWREVTQSDTVLRKDGNYYFCRKIDEPEIIEDEQV